jgi:hypothetical protein
MSNVIDGPSSPLFVPLSLKGNAGLSDISKYGVSEAMAAVSEHAPKGNCVCWGIPFEIGDVLVLGEEVIQVDLPHFTSRWLIFNHTSDLRRAEPNSFGFYSPMRGQGKLGEHAANYIVRYADDMEVDHPVRRRFQLGTYNRIWGENCFEAVAHKKPKPVRSSHEQLIPGWGWSQTRVDVADSAPWVNWLWAWENPYPDKEIVGVRFEPVSGVVIVSGISAGSVKSTPLRWEPRCKAVYSLPEGVKFTPELDENGLLQQIQLDLGQVISAVPRPVYPDSRWPESYNNQNPDQAENQVLVEYTAHPEAVFHLADGGMIPAVHLSEADTAQPETASAVRPLLPVKRAVQRVTIRVLEKGSRKPVPVKLHVHGEWGEYLAPNDRHRIPNPAWFEDYSVDFVHGGEWDGAANNPHYCTYILGEAQIDLPLGNVYIEVSKGFEIRPVRKVVVVTPGMEEIEVEIEKVLPWREKGWVTADTHVHFLSPMSALLEGSAEGVNVVNLLASQWGELVTNVGDFDGKTTWGSLEAGGDGEYLVRVGTENRQHVLGHISLLGYNGKIIAPMTTGGPDESALGDPIEITLTEWARKCKQQGGLTVLPHFPQPRAENAASLVGGDIDAIEMTSWGNLYGGIEPYSLSDWYRYLNCGYLVAAVGGTDKMSANTAVGTVRTYARIAPDKGFNYENWMGAVRSAETFVTYGPLLDFTVDGHPMGSSIRMSASGGRVDVEWWVASVTVPMSAVELVVNGEIRERAAVSSEKDQGSWSFKVDRSSWLALLVRGHYPDKPEIIAAHSSPVMVNVEGSAMMSAADAVTILEQIEGAMAYLEVIGTRAETIAFKRMCLVLSSAHRSIHNRMHQAGIYHDHTPVDDHH